MIDLIVQGQAVRSAFGLPQLHLSVPSATPPPNIRHSGNHASSPPCPKTHRRQVSTEADFRQSAKSATPPVFELCMEAFARDGIELTYQDLSFIRLILPMEPGQRDSALATYKKIWRKAMAAEPLEHKKQNRGRFNANTWLRLQCQK